MLDEPIDAVLEEIARRCTGQLTVCARSLTTDEQVALNADTVMPTASVIKLPILIEVLLRAERGDLDLDARVPMRADDRIGGSGILKVFQSDLQPTLRDLATLMIVVSDNTATNMVLDAVGGVDVVNSTMAALGLHSVRLCNRIDFDVIGADVRRLGEASSSDLCRLVWSIARREFVSRWVSETAEEILGAQQYLDQVPRYMDVSPYWRELGQVPGLQVACKTGFFTGTRVDTGVVRFGGDGFAYSVANTGLVDQSFAAEAEGAVVNGLVGRALLTHWWRGDGRAPVLATAYSVAEAQ